MPFIKELWNNITSFYKNWHKKIKWFSIFIKPNKCQKTRKETEMEKNLPVVTCGPAPVLAQLCAAQLGQLNSAVVLLAPVGQACGRRARTAVPPCHLPACPPPRRLDAPRDARRRPAPLSLSPVPISSSPRSLSRTAERHRRRCSPSP